MRHRHRPLLTGLILTSTVAVAAQGCGSSKGGASTQFSASSSHASAGSTSSGQGGSTANGGSASSTGGTGMGGGIAFGDGGDCTSTCDGGVCVSGTCCASANVCGTSCCTGSTVCLNAMCVTPGSSCYTAGDCGAGYYCETGLGASADAGASDGGIGTSDAGACTQPLPLGGRCLPLPAVCPDGGADPDAGCVANCEYFPPVTATLNAVADWEWGPTAVDHPEYTDIWSTPAVGRVFDTNCDGVVNDLDAPVVIFVSGDDFFNAANGSNCQTANTMTGGTSPSMCHTGVLRMINGSTGAEILTVPNLPGSVGFAGMSVAIGDIDGDGQVDIIAGTGEGNVVVLDNKGNVKRISDKPLAGIAAVDFGWGGGFSIADIDNDGFPEVSFGATVYTTKGGGLTQVFVGTAGVGGGSESEAVSTLVDLDLAPNQNLELLAGNTAYKADGTILWQRKDLPDGFPAVADFDKDGKPDVVLVGPVSNGKMNQATVWILNGLDGTTKLGPVTLPTTVHASNGGPPTVANFDGTGQPEIGVATADYYWMLKPNFTTSTIEIIWHQPNHDFSSSVTGSTVFDFEGAGHPSVIYADECFLWVYDGATGAVRFAAPHTSFTGTEASLVADIAGDGRAHLLMVSNGADPSSAGWGCLDTTGAPVTINGVTWTPSALPNKSYRGLVAFSDSAHSWVGTRTLWNEHGYHVSNICDDRDSACPAPNVYGSIPKVETLNWSLPWLNNFRQNVQDKGIFNAPDAIVSLDVACTVPVQITVSVRNIGLASLPAGVAVNVYKSSTPTGTPIQTVTTTHSLFPGQTEQIPFDPGSAGTANDTYVAQIYVDPNKPTFHECDATNDTSAPAHGSCSQ